MTFITFVSLLNFLQAATYAYIVIISNLSVSARSVNYQYLAK